MASKSLPYIALAANCQCEACQQWVLTYYDEELTFPYALFAEWMSAQPAEQSLLWCDSAQKLRYRLAWFDLQRKVARS